MIKNINQEFLESVHNDTTRSLVKRLVNTKRKIQRYERLVDAGLPTYGNIVTRVRHMKTIRDEILNRMVVSGSLDAKLL